jgi:hypothetical protein
MRLAERLDWKGLKSRNKTVHDNVEEPRAKMNTKGNDVGEIPRAEKTRTVISVTY